MEKLDLRPSAPPTRARNDGDWVSQTRPSALCMSDPVMEFLEILETQEFTIINF